MPSATGWSFVSLYPWLYLKGISTGDFGEALQALLGPEARGLSATTITRLKAVWEQEYQDWSKRSLAHRSYAYVWADGVYFNVRLEDTDNKRQCILVLMGATRDGTKELIAITDGYRESEQSWRELLLDVRHRGLTIDPELAIGDGGLGFWGAVRKVFPQTREQRCWVHKTANVLIKLPTGVQPKAKAMLYDIWMAETQPAADRAFDLFLATFAAKFPAATTCLAKDRDVLLTFYAFPAEHWIHIRTTNPVESTFATVRLRTKKTKGAGSRVACLTMVFKLAMAAEKHWRALNGPARPRRDRASGRDVGVLVRAALPRTAGVAEEYVQPSVDTQLGVLRHLRALVPLGLMHVKEVLDAEVTALAGERYARKDASMGGRRHGSNPGTVGLAGQRVPIRVPRLRRVAGSEIPLRSYAALQGEGAVNDLLLKRVLYGISCRNYEAAVEAIPGAIGLSGSTEPQVLGWYRRAKATKRGGMGGEESECRIVPPKRGN